MTILGRRSTREISKRAGMAHTRITKVVRGIIERCPEIDDYEIGSFTLGKGQTYPMFLIGNKILDQVVRQFWPREMEGESMESTILTIPIERVRGKRGAVIPSTLPVQVHNNNGKITASSLEVAEVFGKQHRSILRALKNLECSPEFREHNFVHVEIIDKNGIGGSVNRSYINMTRDGFSFLIMGFTGRKAAGFKEAYINAFNAMEEKLMAVPKEAPTQGVDRSKMVEALGKIAEGTKNVMEGFSESISMLKTGDKDTAPEVLALELKAKSDGERIKDLEAKLADIEEDRRICERVFQMQAGFTPGHVVSVLGIGYDTVVDFMKREGWIKTRSIKAAPTEYAIRNGLLIKGFSVSHSNYKHPYNFVTVKGLAYLDENIS